MFSRQRGVKGKWRESGKRRCLLNREGKCLFRGTANRLIFTTMSFQPRPFAPARFPDNFTIPHAARECYRFIVVAFIIRLRLYGRPCARYQPLLQCRIVAFPRCKSRPRQCPLSAAWCFRRSWQFGCLCPVLTDRMIAWLLAGNKILRNADYEILDTFVSLLLRILQDEWKSSVLNTNLLRSFQFIFSNIYIGICKLNRSSKKFQWKLKFEITKKKMSKNFEIKFYLNFDVNIITLSARHLSNFQRVSQHMDGKTRVTRFNYRYQWRLI